MTNRVAIIGGARTPFVKAGTVFKEQSALQLAVHSVNGLMERELFNPQAINELVCGIVVVNPRLPHLAREVVLASRLPAEVPAKTLTDNCITGISSIVSIHDSIAAGRIEIGIASGVESMSNPTLAFHEEASRLFMDANLTRSGWERFQILSKLRPIDFLPAAPSIAEPSTGFSMGEHCEFMVKEWGISRQDQDEVAYRSHLNAFAATEDGRLPQEILPLDGIHYDLLIRPDATMQRLSSLTPIFDRSPAGTITAGNASPLTDGAASVLLMSDFRARLEGREPLAFIRGFEFASIDPQDGLLMAPALAVPRLLRKTGLRLADMDIIEMHEAFGGQIECNLRAWAEGWKEPAIGTLDLGLLNPLGSSIAIGHPFSATGVRIASTMAYEMKRRQARYGLISICGAGATAAAMILERD